MLMATMKVTLSDGETFVYDLDDIKTKIDKQTDQAKIDAIAAILGDLNVDENYDTLKEIADYILSDINNNENLTKRIGDLEIAVKSEFKGATNSADGKTGVVPAPKKTNAEQYLKGDGTWSNVPKDWNENKSSNPAYIKNRTHYKEIGTKAICTKLPITYAYDDNFTIADENNNEHSFPMTFQPSWMSQQESRPTLYKGITYSLSMTCVVDSNTMVLTADFTPQNITCVNPISGATGVGFIMEGVYAICDFNSFDDLFILTSSDIENVIDITIVQNNAEIWHALDKNYLPSDIIYQDNLEVNLADIYQQLSSLYQYAVTVQTQPWLTSKEKEQARNNIGAASVQDVKYLKLAVNTVLWTDVQSIIRDGDGPKYFPVGYEFATLDSNTGKDIIWVVRAHDHHTAANNELVHTMTLETKYVYSNSNGSCINLQFNAAEALYYAETGLEPGTYNFTVANRNGYTADNGKTFQFTLTQAVPVGGQVVLSMYTNLTLSGRNVKTYASPASTTVIETATLTEGSEGTNLGTTDGTGNVNHMHRIVYGSNNYAQSAIRQWLNSASKRGLVWTPSTKFDRPPSWRSNTEGFLYGLPTRFLEVIQPTVITCRTNSVFEVNSLDGAEFTVNQVYSLEDKFFLLSCPEVYGTWDSTSYKDGEILEYYEGLTVDLQRRKYDAAGSSSSYWLRSPYPSYCYYERSVNTSGSLYYNNANNNNGIAPACIIA